MLSSMFVSSMFDEISEIESAEEDGFWGLHRGRIFVFAG